MAKLVARATPHSGLWPSASGLSLRRNSSLHTRRNSSPTPPPHPPATRHQPPFFRRSQSPPPPAKLIARLGETHRFTRRPTAFCCGLWPLACGLRPVFIGLARRQKIPSSSASLYMPQNPVPSRLTGAGSTGCGLYLKPTIKIRARVKQSTGCTCSPPKEGVRLCRLWPRISFSPPKQTGSIQQSAGSIRGSLMYYIAQNK